MTTKPPLGCMPRWRAQELGMNRWRWYGMAIAAATRYLIRGRRPPFQTWLRPSVTGLNAGWLNP